MGASEDKKSSIFCRWLDVLVECISTASDRSILGLEFCKYVVFVKDIYQ